MQHQERLEEYVMWRQFKRHKALCTTSVMILAVVQNAIVLVRYSSNEFALVVLCAALNWFFGVLLALSCVIVFCLYALQSGVLSVQERWERAEGGMKFEKILERTRTERGFFVKFVVLTPYYLLQDFQLVFYTFAFLMAGYAMPCHAMLCYAMLCYAMSTPA